MSKTQSFYQSILQNSTLVVKVSGKICDNQENIENVISDIKELLSTISKLKVVLVFGFGRQLDNYMKNVHNLEPKKINGRRITSGNDIEAAKKISGQILIDIFSLSSRYNIRNFPIPISKKDFISAKRREVIDGVDYGQVGDVVSVDALEIQKLFKEHDMIIMPSLVLDKNTAEVLNVNADTIATELAINLSASKLIFISDVPYIKDLQGERISAVDENVAKKLFDEKIITNGMVVKVENSLKALNQGVQKIHIISGEIKNALLTELETEEGIGTVFQKQSLDY
ncbi:MAG: acetylglutamate kinase [alpha proteobacterium HIMB59]|nr:MAG: acetylglutamate kinase [alpha proteobacterium HIMB59]